VIKLDLKRFIESFNRAVNGIISTVKMERNMKIHYLIAVTVLILSLLLNFTKAEFLILIFAISLVLVSELFNTAIEKTVDMITIDYHPYARVIKDISAGAVLIASINSVVVGYLLFFDRLNPFKDIVLQRIKNSPVYLTFVALLIVILVVLGLKSKYHRNKGTHFQGGIVSGHSAVAFLIATIISVLTNNLLVITLSFVLAFLVAESRVEGEIHSTRETVFGAIIGILVGIIIFQLIYK